MRRETGHEYRDQFVAIYLCTFSALPAYRRRLTLKIAREYIVEGQSVESETVYSKWNESADNISSSTPSSEGKMPGSGQK